MCEKPDPAVDFTFTSDAGNRTDELVDYLRGPRLWIPHEHYPDFDDWLERVHVQLKSEEKRALVALSHHSVVGAVIYQKHKTVPGSLEIKNLTVRPDMRGRFIASFLFRNAEVEGAADFDVDSVLIDAKDSNQAIRALLFQQGYRIQCTEELYGLGAGRDVVYGKRIQ